MKDIQEVKDTIQEALDTPCDVDGLVLLMDLLNQFQRKKPPSIESLSMERAARTELPTDFVSPQTRLEFSLLRDKLFVLLSQDEEEGSIITIRQKINELDAKNIEAITEELTVLAKNINEWDSYQNIENALVSSEEDCIKFYQLCEQIEDAKLDVYMSIENKEKLSTLEHTVEDIRYIITFVEKTKKAIVRLESGRRPIFENSVHTFFTKKTQTPNGSMDYKAYIEKYSLWVLRQSTKALMSQLQKEYQAARPVPFFTDMPTPGNTGYLIEYSRTSRGITRKNTVCMLIDKIMGTGTTTENEKSERLQKMTLLGSMTKKQRFQTANALYGKKPKK